MIYPKKPRLKVVLPETESQGRGVNDNRPGLSDGHTMSDLHNVPCPPATESVLHYARISEIGSFPDDHSDAENGSAGDPPQFEPTAEKSGVVAPRRAARTVGVSLISLIAHAAIFSFLAVAMVAEPEEPVEEAGSVVSVTLLGDAEFDQMAAGDPEIVEADSVEPETVEPSETTPVEADAVEPTETLEAEPVETAQAQPVETDQVQPVDTQEVQPVETQQAQPVETNVETMPVETAVPVQSSIVEAQAVAALEPEVLTSTVPAEPIVTQPIASVIPEVTEVTDALPVTASMQPVEQPVTEIVEAVPVMPVEQTTEVVEVKPDTPVLQPVEEKKKPIEKKAVEKKPVQKPKPKPVTEKKKKTETTRTKAGSGGDAEQDRKKGSADGVDQAADTNNGSKNRGRTSSAGTAAVANYPGKVQSRIRRSVRVPNAFKREKASMSVRVRLTIGSSGSLTSVSVARSSGVAELDKAVVDGVRRAAPFPPLPAEWGKPSWSFSQEVQVTGR